MKTLARDDADAERTDAVKYTIAGVKVERTKEKFTSHVDVLHKAGCTVATVFDLMQWLMMLCEQGNVFTAPTVQTTYDKDETKWLCDALANGVDTGYDGPHRMFHDLSYGKDSINKHRTPPKPSNHTLVRAMRYLAQQPVGTRLSVYDISAAFHLLPVLPWQLSYIFSLEGETYTKEQFKKDTKATFAAAKLEIYGYRDHIYRIGGLTALKDAGAEPDEIAAATEWKYRAYMGYGYRTAAQKASVKARMAA
ncbi:hypothetical protein SARC_11586 [Sphaeroforma arctica JP610]|uniref:Uncharacterized protein n=1 Tax=Sphaeroforma arctica JP610 TaxID=667725 RepID=A0A0L0FHE5_9EUKA|nr:hypothetical protein SARC_11586 [Sphaeroforma arctica JP610]KNC75896.1 hypothetical protein SARC_11586 [Sphaeroforma arctica JP610]|eukprot:XP_014149798.1 hypothetical protein SARC_11586 [Sphaeroforma arctica JP610]